MNQLVLSEEVVNIQDKENYFIPNEVEIEGKSDHDLARYLNEITDSIQVNPENITDPVVFDTIRSFLKYFAVVQPRILSRLFDIILSAFRVEIKNTAEDLDHNEKDTFNNHRLHLEFYGFLVHWFLLQAEDNTTTSSVLRKSKSSNNSNDLRTFDWSSQKLKSFDLVSWLFGLKLNKIWTMPPDRIAFVNLFTKPAYQLFENPANVKAQQTKDRVFRIISLCIKHYDHLPVAQTTIMQNLQYWEHSAEPMAELLVFMIEKHNYTQLADEILREISNKEFKDTTNKEVKDSPNPKTFSVFLLKLAELSSKTILKNLTVLINQLDSDSYLMRTTLIDILGHLITELSQSVEENPNHMDQINGFFDLLEERMLDPIAYCRQKVLQVYLRLFTLKAKFPKRRQAAAVLCYRHLQDKSSIVRKYAIRALTLMISTHPYSMYGGELSLEEWNDRMEKLKHEIDNVTTEENARVFMNMDESETQQEEEAEKEADAEQEEESEKETETTEENQDEDVEMTEATQDEEEEEKEKDKENQDPESSEAKEPAADDSNKEKTVVSAEKMQQLVLMHTYHKDAVQFIELLHKATPTITQLLSSKSKAEVLESMDFLVNGYNYKVKPATDGIKKMLHLIWTKDTSDEGKGIKMKLISCYENLYLEFDGKLSRKENINRIAKNLIQLTYDTTLAELTSLEQLLSTLMAENKISLDVIQKLWSVYGFTQGRIQKSQRRGAIIILGMLAKAKTKVVSDKIDVMLKIGCGPLGKADLDLARYTCIALQRLEGIKSKEKGRGVQEGIRFPLNHPIFTRLRDIIESPSGSQLWFNMAEQALNTIFLLCKNPESICAEIIRDKTAKVFGQSSPSSTPSVSMDTDTIDYDSTLTQQALPFPQQPVYTNTLDLAQLFFLVGHVALKEIVHLEIVESAWKRKKSTNAPQDQNGGDDELEQVAGTAEDDIGDAMTKIREREILFGPHSLLGVYGPLITEVCARNKIYTDRILQLNATLALTKFMCVSSDFCEQKLQLLFTILEKSKDASIRSNIVIGLGDMAVCFSTLIDDNITFLYNRLSDSDTIVRKNAVMVLTHLILNGMVKVKGQISEMAKCLDDADQRIADLAKLFFTELASKDNQIYNNLPDIISSLTTNNDKRLGEESFRKIMKFIFSFDFTEKEKNAENIVDKLCQRFLTAEDERSWRDIAFCLSLLPFKTERPFKKLLDGWPTYQDKVHEEAVHKSFLEIIQKGRFNKNQKPELKALVDELDQKLGKLQGSENEEETSTVKKTKRPAKKGKKEKKPAPVKKEVRKRKRVVESSDEEDVDMDLTDHEEEEEEDEDDFMEEEEKPVVKARPQRRARKVIQEDTDEEDDDEDVEVEEDEE